MKKITKNLLYPFLPFFDILYIPFIFLASIVMLCYKRIGSKSFLFCTKMLRSIGVVPVYNHYYDPFYKSIDPNLHKSRFLLSELFCSKSQLNLLSQFTYKDDFQIFLDNICLHENSFKSLNNGSFEHGDAEILFNFVKHFKPQNVIEIGCGFSTKIIQAALGANFDTKKLFTHTCVEPFEQNWLESYPDINLIRDKVENLSLDYFSRLKSGDFLFIDSSHIIKPNGDIIFEYINILPKLNSGVFIHIHDIFTPFDYPLHWFNQHNLFWNEQYVLEAILSNSNRYKILFGNNFMHKLHFTEFCTLAPGLTKNSNPGSIYLQVQ